MMKAVIYWFLFFSAMNFLLTIAQDYTRFELTEFRVGEVVASFEDAKKECLKDDAVIPSIKTSKVSLAVRKMVGKKVQAGLTSPYAFYIGLKRYAPENIEESFKWIDDGTVLTRSYSNWETSFPNNGNASCVIIGSVSSQDPFLRWRDYPCTTEARLLCERVPGHIRITPDGSFHHFKAAEYFFGSTVESYADAETDCISKAGNVAIISDKETYDFVVEEIEILDFDTPSYSYYIGLRRIASKNSSDSFKWVSGKSLTGGFSKWNPGEPTNDQENENCVILAFWDPPIYDYNWRDVFCSTVARYICQLADTDSSGVANFMKFDDQLYYFGPPVKNFIVAQDSCKRLNATMVTIKNEITKEFLVNISQTLEFKSFPFSFYIGLERINPNKNDSGFQWTDGTPLTDYPNISQWLDDNPDNEGFNENCVIMGWIYQLDSNFSWLDINCDALSRFICQKSITQDSLFFGVNQVLRIIATLPRGYLVSVGIGLLVVVCLAVIFVMLGRVSSLRAKLKVAKLKRMEQKALLEQPEQEHIEVAGKTIPMPVKVAESAYFETTVPVDSSQPENKI